jgi:hypothetical protein
MWERARRTNLRGMLPKRTILTAVAVAALALPAAASASDTIGSSFWQPDPAQTAGCGGAASCTFVQQRYIYSTIDAPAGEILTSFKALLAPGSHVRFVVLRRDGDGTYTPVARTPEIAGSAAGGVQRFTTHLAVPAGAHTIGVDVLSGAVGATADDAGILDRFAPAIATGQTATSSESLGRELQLSAQGEPDADGDGLADETEDPCVGTCAPPPPPPPAGGDTGTGGTGGGGGDTSGGGTPAASGLAIDAQGVLATGNRGTFVFYARARGKENLAGTYTLSLGRKAIGRGKLSVEWGADVFEGTGALPRAALRTLTRKGRITVQIAAKVKGARLGSTFTTKRAVTILRGGDARYDGTYRGPGPLVIKVDHGVVRTIAVSLLTMSTSGSGSRMVSFVMPEGMPVLVKRDGSFSGKGSYSQNDYRWSGKLKRSGRSSGQISIWHTEFSLGSGSLSSEVFYAAKRWTATRGR